ncbi:unnamed protein product [Porites evermanni]|uniref:Ig-like domain-containing protein n=1 Tax=Porites evermanni TaxID=104178 RepID=A0ABN8SQI2_9CNID|nr:unnamed protein product [Porites evermanni]
MLEGTPPIEAWLNNSPTPLEGGPVVKGLQFVQTGNYTILAKSDAGNSSKKVDVNVMVSFPMKRFNRVAFERTGGVFFNIVVTIERERQAQDQRFIQQVAGNPRWGRFTIETVL